MMTPDNESKDGNRQARVSHELITENPLSGETGDHLADHAHARQDHDIHRRMGVEPEQVLK